MNTTINPSELYFDELFQKVVNNKDKETAKALGKEIRRRVGQMQIVEILTRIENTASERGRNQSTGADKFYATMLNALECEVIRRVNG